MKIFIIAGEASGDNIGSLIMKEIKSRVPKAKFFGVGGNKMESCGLKSLFPLKEISLMGFAEILPHIFKLKRLIKKTSDSIIQTNPDIVVTIDSPGFCSRVAKNVKGKFDGKLVHVVAPSVWAYKPERAKKFANIYDLLLAMLPFEPKYFEKEGLKTEFVGHFSFEEKLCDDPNLFRNKYNIKKDEKIICITPGSREGEVKRHMDFLLKTIDKLSTKHKIKPVFLAANNNLKKMIATNLGENNNSIITTEDKFELYKAADLAIAKSGTNSFEIALHGTPQIIAYKVNFISWIYIKFKILIKFANLINISANREIIPEFLQQNATAENIYKAADELLSNAKIRSKQLNDTKKILDDLKCDKGKASALSAEAIFNLLIGNKK